MSPQKRQPPNVPPLFGPSLHLAMSRGFMMVMSFEDYRARLHEEERQKLISLHTWKI